jgi:glycosyltransferase involved in cell wall biosynthesis
VSGPRVTVLMPAHDGADTLLDAVRSVMAQTAGDLELVVVDDGSPRPLRSLLTEIRDRRLRVVRHARRRGAAAARNTALRCATSPLVAQLDADDMWEPGYLEAVLPAFDDPGVGLAYANAAIIGHPDGERDYIPDPAIHPLDRFPGLAVRNPIPSPTVTMRTAAVRAAGGWAGWLRGCEDYHVYLRLAAAGWRFAYVHRLLASYRWPTPARGKSGRLRRHRSWELAARLHFAARHPRVPGAAPAVRRAARRVLREPRAAAPRLAYVAGAYPQLSETFVLDEIRELGRQSSAPAVVAVMPGDGRLDGAPPAVYLGTTTRGQRLRATAMLLSRHPMRTTRALASPSRRLGGSLSDMLALAPYARGLHEVRHVHAHFATDPATIGRRLAALTGAGFSFTAHAYDIHLVRDHLDEKLAAARMVVVGNDFNRRWLREHAPADAHKIRLVRHGVDLDRFRRRLPYDPDGPLVAVARLVPKKGLPTLVHAAALTSGAIPPVVVIGEGDQRAELEALIDRLGAPVRLEGALPHREIPRLLEDASAFALPCTVLPNGDRDGLPTALLEAMAMELPVVSTLVSGIPETISEECGVLVDDGDPEALARALRELYGRPVAEREAMGRAGRARVAQRHELTAEVAALRHAFAAAGVI